MIESIEASPCLPYIQLAMVAVFFFVLYLLIGNQQSPLIESVPVQIPQNDQNEVDLQSPDPSSESNLKQLEETSDYCENFIFNQETGKTNFVSVKYSK